MRPAERIEVDMCHGLYASPPAHRLRVGEAVCVGLPALPGVRMMNRAVGITARTSDSELDEVEAFFADLGVQYQLVPAEAGLEERLTERGLAPGYPWMKFTRGVAPMAGVRSDLRVERVDDGAATTYARVVRETWGFPDELDEWLATMVVLPGWTCYVTYAGDEPAGAAALYVAGDAGWLGFGSTLPGFRGRGSQSALFETRIADAAARGATLVVTETGVPGDDDPGTSYRNILRAGFEEAYVRPNFVRP